MKRLTLAALGTFSLLTFTACSTERAGSAVKDDAAAAAPCAEPRTLDDLKALGADCLERLFADGKASKELIPGVDQPGQAVRGDGLAILMAGAMPINEFARTLWGGKIFTTTATAAGPVTTLVNDLGVTGLETVSAKVTYVDKSLTGDDKGSILLDYSGSNYLSARAIRDEIRAVGPGLYLGKATIKNSSAFVVGSPGTELEFAL